MKPETKNIIAKEWLIFIMSLLIGLTIFPWLFSLAAGQFHPELFYGALIGLNGNTLGAWFFVLCPYILYQLGRTIVWAIKITKNK